MEKEMAMKAKVTVLECGCSEEHVCSLSACAAIQYQIAHLNGQWEKKSDLSRQWATHRRLLLPGGATRPRLDVDYTQFLPNAQRADNYHQAALFSAQ